MSYLAKQILKGKKQKNCDDLGIPTEDGNGNEVLLRPQYLVARALLLEQKDSSYDANSIKRLHIRDSEIYQNNRLIPENTNSFYRLTYVNYAVPRRTQILFWEEMHRRLPTLDPSKFKICDGLWWDKKNGEIIAE